MLVSKLILASVTEPFYICSSSSCSTGGWLDKRTGQRRKVTLGTYQKCLGGKGRMLRGSRKGVHGVQKHKFAKKNINTIQTVLFLYACLSGMKCPMWEQFWLRNCHWRGPRGWARLALLRTCLWSTLAERTICGFSFPLRLKKASSDHPHWDKYIKSSCLHFSKISWQLCSLIALVPPAVGQTKQGSICVLDIRVRQSLAGTKRYSSAWCSAGSWAPHRYCFSHSLGMQPGNKRELAELKPACKRISLQVCKCIGLFILAEEILRAKARSEPLTSQSARSLSFGEDAAGGAGDCSFPPHWAASSPTTNSSSMCWRLVYIWKDLFML